LTYYTLLSYHGMSVNKLPVYDYHNTTYDSCTPCHGNNRKKWQFTTIASRHAIVVNEYSEVKQVNR